MSRIQEIENAVFTELTNGKHGVLFNGGTGRKVTLSDVCVSDEEATAFAERFVQMLEDYADSACCNMCMEDGLDTMRFYETKNEIAVFIDLTY